MGWPVQRRWLVGNCDRFMESAQVSPAITWSRGFCSTRRAKFFGAVVGGLIKSRSPVVTSGLLPRHESSDVTDNYGPRRTTRHVAVAHGRIAGGEYHHLVGYLLGDYLYKYDHAWRV